MKVTDDYDAKLDLWARNPKAAAVPKLTGLPRFGVKRFASYAELNAWKSELFLALAGKGGGTWTR